MASSSSGHLDTPTTGSNSSSSRSPANPTTASSSKTPYADDFEEDQEHSLLSEDPLEQNAPQDILSFKRKQKASALPSFLSSLARGRRTPQSSASGAGLAGSNRSPKNTATSGGGENHGINNGSTNGQAAAGNDQNYRINAKDGTSMDWYSEGPGRRVGYDDLTAIDWIFEYTKERQRLRALYSGASGLVGHVIRLLDASQIWIILILTGLSSGIVAAGISVAGDWLGDIKSGYCSAGADGGRFYLNKYFCCWAYEEWSQCSDWVRWSDALHIRNAAGSYIMEYIFFISFSVSVFLCFIAVVSYGFIYCFC